MNHRCTALILTLLYSGLVSASSFAGEYFEKGGVAIAGYDPVAYYFTDMKPVKDSQEFHAEYQGSTFYFVPAAHRDTFIANPAKFAPQHGSYCAFGMAKGYKAAIDPAHSPSSATSSILTTMGRSVPCGSSISKAM